MSAITPKIDHWYQDRDSGALFEIVAWDADEGTIQLQYLDGEIADYDLDSWSELSLRPAAAPEDWRSAFELDRDDEIDPDAAWHPTTWASPLTSVEPDAMCGVEEF